MKGKVLKRLVRWISESWMMFAFFACFFLLWEWSIDWFEVPQYILNKPSEIITNSAADLPRLMQYTYITGLETVLGFVVAICLAIPIGVAITFFKHPEKNFVSISRQRGNGSQDCFCTSIHFMAGIWPAPKSHYCLLGLFLPNCFECDSCLWFIESGIGSVFPNHRRFSNQDLPKDSYSLCSTSMFCRHQVCCYQRNSRSSHCRIHWK